MYQFEVPVWSTSLWLWWESVLKIFFAGIHHISKNRLENKHNGKDSSEAFWMEYYSGIHSIPFKNCSKDSCFRFAFSPKFSKRVPQRFNGRSGGPPLLCFPVKRGAEETFRRCISATIWSFILARAPGSDFLLRNIHKRAVGYPPQKKYNECIPRGSAS